jgi:CRP/FNR family transcriptional regulator
MQAMTAVQNVTPLVRIVPSTRTATLRQIGGSTMRCSMCHLKERCMPGGLEPDSVHLIDSLVGRRIRLRKGEALFRAGEKFTSLYAVRSGSCKTVLPGDDGQEQVAGYHMPGDVIGTDGIGADSHDCKPLR